MAPTIPFVLDPKASTYLEEAAKSLFAFDGSRTMCSCKLCFLTKDMLKCSHCPCTFEDALEFQQTYILERFKAEIIAIDESAKALLPFPSLSYPKAFPLQSKTFSTIIYCWHLKKSQQHGKNALLMLVLVSIHITQPHY